jgi:ribonuclease E
MTRQRMRPSLQLSTYLTCPHCGGAGFVKSHESMAIEVMRMLSLAGSNDRVKRVELLVSPEIAEYLQNEKRAAIAQVEQGSDKRVVIRALPQYTGERCELICYNDRGSVVKL